ncbi:MAG: DUF432 domain-containing protein [Methanocorpusculum sp.]|nr:DUF432 domain-containing protein [Methanocorpusculum sp.]
MRITRSRTARDKIPVSVPVPENAGEPAEDMPFFNYGAFSFDYAINFSRLSISIEQKLDMYHYHRELGKWKRDTNVSVKEGRMLLHPVEPLYLPEAVTDYLEIRFDEVMIEPRGTSILFLTFPIEIGVFIQASGVTSILDVVSFKTPKYSLYGNANRGVITRWHKSGVFSYPPRVRNYLEGVLRLQIENTTDDWINVSRAVIHEKGMQVYFDEHFVSMAAEMVITSGGTAAVTGVARPLHEGMTRSLRMYEPRRSASFSNAAGSLIDSTFIMDAGLT